MKGTPPYDEDAERNIIGVGLLSPNRMVDIVRMLSPDDFYVPKWRAAWAAYIELWNQGIFPSPVSLADAARKHGLQEPADLITAQVNSCGFPSALRSAEIILRHKASRDLGAKCAEASNSIGQDEDPYAVAEELSLFAKTLGLPLSQPQAVPIDTFLDNAEEAAPWLIPGICRTDSKGIIVGSEGAGKFVTMRSLAMCLAQGFHAFTHQPIEPARTLSVELENSHAAIYETAHVLRRTLHMHRREQYDYDSCKIVQRIEGLRIRNRRDRAFLTREIAAHRPALVIIGPLNKVHSVERGESYEDAAIKTQQVFDELQQEFGFALLIEHHAPKAQNGARREMLPMGSQMWMGWPEFGIGLNLDAEDKQTLHIEHFRRPRLKLSWPTAIMRDPDWLVRGYWQYGDIPT